MHPKMGVQKVQHRVRLLVTVKFRACACTNLFDITFAPPVFVHAHARSRNYTCIYIRRLCFGRHRSSVGPQWLLPRTRRPLSWISSVLSASTVTMTPGYFPASTLSAQSASRSTVFNQPPRLLPSIAQSVSIRANSLRQA